MLRVLDRPHAVWISSQQSDLWDALRVEFDIKDRFKTLDFKVTLVSESCQFFLSILHSLKSKRLEHIIIALIAVEVVIGVLSLYIGYFDIHGEKAVAVKEKSSE